MKRLALWIDHDPISWKRPGQAGKLRYDTQKQIKQALSYHFKLAMQKAKLTPFTGGVSVKIVAYFKLPKKYLKSKTHPLHIDKPDGDNLEKIYLDTMTMAGIWNDDCQACKLSIDKHYIHKETPNFKPAVYFEILELYGESDEGTYEDISRARRETPKT
jgi:Holliday junction resolvase RusA-like endonuclease